jgi:hypothetical protein
MDSYFETELGYFRFYQLRNKDVKWRCCKLPSNIVNKLSFTLVICEHPLSFAVG